MQCVGGTGAVRMGAELLYRYANRKIVYITDPSWRKYSLIMQYVTDPKYITGL